MSEHTTIETQQILSALRGGSALDFKATAKEHPELLSRCVAYVIKHKPHHRENLCRAVVCIINYTPTIYRGIGWSLLQQLPLSYLTNLVKKQVKTSRETIRPLRHALATKLATTTRNEIFRAFFIAHSRFCDLFNLYIPHKKISVKEKRGAQKSYPITNPSYTLAYRLSQLTIPAALKEFHIAKADLLTKFGIQLDKVMDLITTPAEATELADRVSSQSFFEHGRWYRNILGDAKYDEIAIKQIAGVKDPVAFLSKKRHLEETNVLTPQLTELLEARARTIFKELLTDFKLTSLALLVDVSGSMNVAVDITAKLYEVFSRMITDNGSDETNVIHDLIAFNHIAMDMTPQRLVNYTPNGSTSIGAAIVKLVQRLEARDAKYLPQGIILVTDWGENQSPRISDPDVIGLLNEYNAPPIVVIHCGSREPVHLEYRMNGERITYPHAIIPVDTFHSSLATDIVKEIVRGTAKVVVKERKITQAVKSRRPIEELVGSIDLPERPPETYKHGYLKRLLCPTPSQ